MAFNPYKRQCPSYGTDNVEAWADTEIEEETYSFLWTLKKYSAFVGSAEVRSPIFIGGPKSKHSWQLILNPKKKFGVDDYFSVYLLLPRFGDGDTSKNLDRKIRARFKITVLQADGLLGKSVGGAFMNPCEFTNSSQWGNKLISSTDLISPMQGFLKDDCIKVHCKIWIDGEVSHKLYNCGAAKPMPEVERMKKRKQELGNDFGRIFKESVMSDITVSTSNHSFFAHKIVLSGEDFILSTKAYARSSVFAAMFKSNMTEKALNAIEIIDFDDNAVKGMLDYLYTGETELMAERAPDLLQIAEKYDLPGLKEDCQYSISENLTVENAAEMLVLAHTYNAELLKKRTVDYINYNKDEVKKTNSFLTLAYVHSNIFVDLYISQK